MKPKLRLLMAGVFLLIPVFSGCIGDDGSSASTDDATGDASSTDGTDATDGPGASTDVSDTVGPTSSGSGGPVPPSQSPGANKPPRASLEVSVVDEAIHTYHFDGSLSTDPEGKPLNYLFDLGDGNSSTEESFDYTYVTAPGVRGDVTYLAKLTVTDAAGDKAEATHEIRFVAGPPPGTLYFTHEDSVSGTLPVGTAPGFVGNELVQKGVDYEDYPLSVTAAAPDGTPVATSRFVIALDSTSETTVDMDLYFYDPAGNEVAKAATEAADETINYDDDALAAGDYTIRVVNWAGVASGYTVTWAFDYFTV